MRTRGACNAVLRRCDSLRGQVADGTPVRARAAGVAPAVGGLAGRDNDIAHGPRDWVRARPPAQFDPEGPTERASSSLVDHVQLSEAVAIQVRLRHEPCPTEQLQLLVFERS